MKSYAASPLFVGVEEIELEKVLGCLGGTVRRFGRGEPILLAGPFEGELGLFLSGKGRVARETVDGEEATIGILEKGDLFAETYAVMGAGELPVSVFAVEESQVLFLRADKLLHPCAAACPFHLQLITNLLAIIAGKSKRLNDRMFYLTHKTIRSRLESYFYDCAKAAGGPAFTLPMSQSELANYLCIDRSAMCRELGHMKEEGLVKGQGRTFTWLGEGAR